MSALWAVRMGDHAEHGRLSEGRDGAGDESTRRDVAGDGEEDHFVAGGGPAILRAYDASNISNELYDSTQNASRDTAGLALKFTSPTIAGGHVLVGTSNELDIYGLLNK
jgi:hypothetical protein